YNPMDLEDEIYFLQEEINSICKNSPVVFSHCDLQENNILICNNTNELRMIDFEYSEGFERGFDLANTLLEMKIDYIVDHYPGYQYYPDDPKEGIEDLFLESYAKTIQKHDSNVNVDIEQLRREVRIFELVSHLQWGLWGIVQGASPSD